MHAALARTFLAALLAVGVPMVALAQNRPRIPESPAARALAGVAGTQSPHPLSAASELLPELLAAPEPWALAATWTSWAEWIEAEALAAEPSPARRVALCLLARAQGRDEDAWGHLAAAGGDPSWVATGLPYLWPGIATDIAPGSGARPAALPNGVRLVPALPPGSDAVMRTIVPRAEMVLRNLQIGAGRVHMRMILENIGVEIELVHAGGEPVELELVLPTPAGFELRVEYINWMRLDDVGKPRRVRVAPEDEESTQLFARFERRREPMPATPRGELPAGLELGGLWLDAGAADPEVASEEMLAAAAAALGRLAGVSSGVRASLGSEGAPAFSGTVIRLRPGNEGTRTLARIASAVEAWRLTGAR